MLKEMAIQVKELTSATLSADGSLLVTGSYGGLVQVWDTHSGKEVASCGTATRESPINDMVLIQDSSTYVLHVCGPWGHVVTYIFDKREPSLRQTTSWRAGHSPKWRLLQVDKEVFTYRNTGLGVELHGRCAGYYKYISLICGDHGWGPEWDLDSGAESESFSASGQVLAASYADGTVRLWDTIEEKEIGSFCDHNSGVESTALSADGKILAVSVGRGPVAVWDTANPGTKPIYLDIDVNSFHCHVAISPSGSTVAVGMENGSARVWDLRSGRCCIYTGLERSPARVVLSGNERHLSVVTDNSVRLWNL